MSNTSIEWTTTTNADGSITKGKAWNPLRGCSMAKGSETGGCLNCYAARMSARNLPELRSPTTGKSFARILQSGPRWTGDVELIESQLGAPLHWRKPVKIFVNSMSDLFHESVPDEWIDRIFAVMLLCPRHTFQVLTKRPRRAVDILSRYGVRRNIHIGFSAENQETFDDRWVMAMSTLGALGWMVWCSYEPALELVDMRMALQGIGKLSWIVIGGESGPGARPFDPEWARNTIAQCRAAGVPCFVKQWGSNPVQRLSATCERPWFLEDSKGGDPEEWPEWSRVREFPKEKNA